MARNPIKDQVAIVGIGTTGFTRTSDRTPMANALDTSAEAIRDAGLTTADIDGVVCINEPGTPGPEALATALGLENVTHFTKPTPVVMNAVVDAMNAVFSGSCDTVLVCSTMLRLPWNSRSAANDPFRRHLGSQPATGIPETIVMAPAYTAGQPLPARVPRDKGALRPGRGQHAHQRGAEPARGDARPDDPRRLRGRRA